jgi:hypothetical protein
MIKIILGLKLIELRESLKIEKQVIKTAIKTVFIFIIFTRIAI